MPEQPHTSDPEGLPQNRPLWAPWRIDFLRGGPVDDCFVCRKAAETGHDETNHVVARREHCLVLLNTFPYNSGHLLVCPYRHVGDLAQLTRTERTEIMDTLALAQAVVNAVMQPHGFNLGCNEGRAAGAALAEHIHFHLVPRWQGDTNFMPVIAESGCVPEALDTTWTLLKAAWEAHAAAQAGEEE